MDSMLPTLSVQQQREPEYAMRGKQHCSSRTDSFGIQDNGQIARFNGHMLDWERTLDDRNHHAAVPTRIEVTMRGIFCYEYGVSSPERRMVAADHYDALTLPAEHHLIGHGMSMKAVLLAWFEAVDVAMELIGLPDPLPHKTVWRKLLN
jgi:hypothetical protein